MQFLENTFKLKANKTNVRTEIVGGLTTFFAMAYIIFVNPNYLSATGMDFNSVMVATCLGAAIGCFLTAFLANVPFAQAPGMGLNAFFTYTVVLSMGCTWQFALTAVLLEGILFIILSLLGGVIGVALGEVVSVLLSSFMDIAFVFSPGAVALGVAVIYALNYLIDRKTNPEVPHIDESHSKTADDLDELIHSNHLEVHQAQNGSRLSLLVAGMVMACAIALHNLPEGMTIGASYASNGGVMDRSAFVLAVILGLHDIPEGMAISVPLISGGMSRGKAVILTALSGLPTVLGALIGYAIGGMGAVGLALSLGFASGAMLYVVFGETIPQAILMYRSKLPAFSVIIGMLTGLLIIFA